MESTNVLLEAFQTALTTVQGDVMSYVQAALPVALVIMGTILAIRIGIHFFKSIAN